APASPAERASANLPHQGRNGLTADRGGALAKGAQGTAARRATNVAPSPRAGPKAAAASNRRPEVDLRVASFGPIRTSGATRCRASMARRMSIPQARENYVKVLVVALCQGRVLP